MSKETSIVRANSVFTGSFQTDDRFSPIHRDLWWLGRSIRFFTGFKVRHSFTDENTLIFIGTFTVRIIRVAVGGTGILEIVTSFVVASQSFAGSATVSIIGVGLILFVSTRASGARRWCWWKQSYIQRRYLDEVVEFVLDDASVQVMEEILHEVERFLQV